MITRNCKPNRSQPRRGSVLVLFALVVFGVLALGAVIDVGMARVAQQQMQSAADTAALEGIKFRDDIPVAWQDANTAPPDLVASIGPPPGTPTTFDPADPQWKQYIDRARRWAASQMVLMSFDDNLDATDFDPIELGAGPVVEFVDDNSVPELAASQTLVLPDIPLYQPRLKMNIDGNAPQGDMVSGTYGLNDGYPVDDPHDEQGSGGPYVRRDFVPSGDISGDAMLVRMRRTNESFDPGDSARSGGPPLPLVFGRGSLVSAEQKLGGIPVRATAIASGGSSSLGAAQSMVTGRAMSAGPAWVDPDASSAERLPGLTPFGLTSAFWATLTAGTQAPGTVSAAGDISSNATSVGQTATPVLMSIGQSLVPATDTTPFTAIPAADRKYFTYVPLFAPLGDVPQAVVGFGFVEWAFDGGTTLTLTKRANRIGRGNVSATLANTAGNSFIGPGATGDFAALWAAHQSVDSPLLAPVLVNRHIGPTAP